MPAEVIQNGKSILNVDSIKMKKELMFREKLYEDTVEEYQERYENGFYMDPIKVYEVKGEGRLLVDGFHRLTAAKRAGCEQINAILEYGSYKDAEWAAANANLKHGRILSREEKKKVAALYLRRYPERADNWIAEDVGISHNTVREIREELESTCQIDKLNELVGKDGKRRPRTRQPSRKSEQKSGDQKAKVEDSGRKRKESADQSGGEKREERVNLIDDEDDGLNPAEKVLKNVKEAGKTAKDWRLTEWDDDGNKIVKDRDGNVIEYVEADRSPEKTERKASASSKASQSGSKSNQRSSTSGRRDYHKINWHKLFPNENVGDVNTEYATINELIDEDGIFFDINKAKDPFMKAWIVVLNMSYERLLWDEDVYEDTLEFNGRKFAVKIKEIKNDNGEQEDDEVDDVDDELDLDDEFDESFDL